MKILTCGLTLLCLLLPALPALHAAAASSASSLAISGPAATASFWTSRQPTGETVQLTAGQISAINTRIQQRTSSLHDLHAYPAIMTRQQVQQEIITAAQDFDPTVETVPAEFAGKTPLTREQWQAARRNCALDELPGHLPVRYAVTTSRTDLRLLPTQAGWYHTPDDIHYDDLQGSALDPAQPVLILAVSRDQQFAFVIARDYQGWALRSQLAATDYASWLMYLQPKNFAVITDHQKTFNIEGNSLLFQMGAAIPYTRQRGRKITLLLPQANDRGQLVSKKLTVPLDDTLHQGFLPFTPNNLIRQAFRFLGDEYGWGGQNNSVDCSSFVQDVYRSLGIQLPRDGDQQELAMPMQVSLQDCTPAARSAKIREARLGALFFKPGHVMLYLGQDEQGNPLVIHSASSYFTWQNDQPQKHYIRQVLVSDLSYQNSSGISTSDSLTSIGSIY